jgi:hypothetical protein
VTFPPSRDLLEQIEIEERKERHERQLQSDSQAIGSLLQGPPVGSSESFVGEEGLSSLAPDLDPPSPSSDGLRHSFATVTQVPLSLLFSSPRDQMGGNFPSLGDSAKQRQQKQQTQPQKQPKSCWGVSAEKNLPPAPASTPPAGAAEPSPRPSASKKFTRKKAQMVPLDLGLFSDPRAR